MKNIQSLPDKAFLAYTKQRIENWNSNSSRTTNLFSNFYHKNLLRIYRSIIPVGSRVLEIGCGNGNLLAGLGGLYLVGIDFSEKKINEAKTLHPQCHFFMMDAHSLDLGSENFDFIILSDLLNDVWDVQKILEQIKPYCKKETRIVLNIYSHLWNFPLQVARFLRLARPQLLQNWLTIGDIFNFLKMVWPHAGTPGR